MTPQQIKAKFQQLFDSCKLYHAGERGEWSMLVIAASPGKARCIAQKNWPAAPTPDFIDIDVWRADDELMLLTEGDEATLSVPEFRKLPEEAGWNDALELRKEIIL